MLALRLDLSVDALFSCPVLDGDLGWLAGRFFVSGLIGLSISLLCDLVSLRSVLFTYIINREKHLITSVSNS